MIIAAIETTHEIIPINGKYMIWCADAIFALFDNMVDCLLGTTTTTTTVNESRHRPWRRLVTGRRMASEPCGFDHVS